MTPSDRQLTRASTQWLDRQDSAEDSQPCGDGVVITSSLHHQKSEWETILGKLSPESSLDSPKSGNQNGAPKGCKKSSSSGSVCVVEVGDGNFLQNTERVMASPPWNWGLQLSIHARGPGSARFISTRSLLALRVLFLSALAMSAGILLRKKEEFSTTILTSELFVWVGVTYAFVLPFLIFASVSTQRLPAATREEAEMQNGGMLWQAVGLLSHVAGCFAQVEIIRFLILRTVPSLRPYAMVQAKETLPSLYSFASLLAVQRYLLVGTSLSELILSCTTHRPYFILIVLPISACWELSVYRVRVLVLEKSTAARIGILLGSIVLAVGISVINFLISRMMASSASPISASVAEKEPSIDDIF